MEHDAASYTCPLQRLCDILAKLRVGQDGINDFEITGSKRHVRSRPASPAADFEARLSKMLTCDVEKEHRLVAREEADGRVATIYIPVMPYLTTKIRPHIRGFRSDDHIRKRRVERYNLKARRNIITVQWLRPFHIRPFDPPVNRVRSGVPLRRSCDHTGAARRPCRLYRFMARRAEKRQTRDLHRRRACAAAATIPARAAARPDEAHSSDRRFWLACQPPSAFRPAGARPRTPRGNRGLTAFALFSDLPPAGRHVGPPASLIIRGLVRAIGSRRTDLPALSVVLIAQVPRFARACGPLLEHGRILPNTPRSASGFARCCRNQLGADRRT